MLTDKMGKFSTKLVKILAYQKNDYETQFAEDAAAETAAKAGEAGKAAAAKKKKKQEEDEKAAKAAEG